MTCSSKAVRLAIIAVLSTRVLAGCALPAFLRPAPLADAPAPAASSSYLDRLASDRAAELAQARSTQDEVTAATARLAPALQARLRGIRSSAPAVTDPASKATRHIDTFDSLTLDLPLGLKGTPEHDAAMAAVKRLALLLARQRGGAEIVRAYAPADAHADKIHVSASSVKTPEGQDITVRKQIDAEQLRGFERVIVHAATPPASP